MAGAGVKFAVIEDHLHNAAKRAGLVLLCVGLRGIFDMITRVQSVLTQAGVG
jgi:hypothetical protein